MKIQIKVALAIVAVCLTLSGLAAAHLYREIVKAEAAEGPVPAMGSSDGYGPSGR